MSEKAKCVIAYIFGWIGGLIVLFAVKDSERNTRFHAAQAIVISVAYFIISIAYSLIPITIPFFGTALWVVEIVLIVMGIVKANQGGEPELPVIGSLTKSIFGKVIDK